MSKLLLQRKRLEASICRDSLYDFVRRFWSVVVQETPVWNWHIEAICNELQEAVERVIRGEPKQHDIVLNVPPGSTKSLIASVMLPAWFWTRFPTGKIISASHTHSLAMSHSMKSRDIVQSDKWRELFGDIELREDQNAKANFQNKDGGWRFAVGVDGDVVGRHAHIVIVDDPIDPQSAVSEANLSSANRFITETLSQRKVDKDVTLTILIMQRLHQNDPSAVLLKEAAEGGTPVRHLKFPGVVMGNPLKFVRPRKYARFYQQDRTTGHHLLDPTRLSIKVLEATERRLGQYGYSGQILQHPVPPGGGMFKTEKITIEPPPPLRHFKQLCRFWDKAGTTAKENPRAAFTAGVLMGEDQKGFFWWLDVVRGQWDSGAREEKILQTAKTDCQGDMNLLRKIVFGTEQEPGSGGKESARGTVKKLAGFRCRIDRPTGDKVQRADPLSVQVNIGNTKMAPGPWNSLLLQELQFFPHSTYKDQVDGSSGAFTVMTRPRTRVTAS